MTVIWHFVIVILIVILIVFAMSRLFDHEKLEVDQASLSFIVWLEPVLERLPRSLAVMDQLDRASPSIPLNIAEGNGKFTSALIKANSDYRLHEGSSE